MCLTCDNFESECLHGRDDLEWLYWAGQLSRVEGKGLTVSGESDLCVSVGQLDLTQGVDYHFTAGLAPDHGVGHNHVVTRRDDVHIEGLGNHLRKYGDYLNLIFWNESQY